MRYVILEWLASLVLAVALVALLLSLGGCEPTGSVEPCFRVAEPRGRVSCDTSTVIVQPPQ